MANEAVDPSDVGEVDAPPVPEALDELIFPADESVATGQSRTPSFTSPTGTPTRRSRPTRRATPTLSVD